MAARCLGCGVGRLLGGLRGVGARGPGVPRLWSSAPAAPPGSYQERIALAAREPAAFWGPLAKDVLVWDTPYHTVSDCDFRSGKIGWFLGGQLNVSGEWARGPWRPSSATAAALAPSSAFGRAAPSPRPHPPAQPGPLPCHPAGTPHVERGPGAPRRARPREAVRRLRRAGVEGAGTPEPDFLLPSRREIALRSFWLLPPPGAGRRLAWGAALPV